MATYEMNMSLTELFKLLFKSKKCVHCGVKMVRIKDRDDLGVGWHRDEDSDGYQVEYDQKYNYSFSYRCHDCARTIALRDL